MDKYVFKLSITQNWISILKWVLSDKGGIFSFFFQDDMILEQSFILLLDVICFLFMF